MRSVWRWLAPLLVSVILAGLAWVRVDVRAATTLELASLSFSDECGESIDEPEHTGSPQNAADEVSMSAPEPDDDVENLIGIPTGSEVKLHFGAGCLHDASGQRGPPRGEADRDVPPPRQA